MLCNPPRLIAKLAVKARESLAPFTARVRYDGKHVLAEPRQQLRTNFRSDVLSRRILGRGLKFLLEFCVPGWIEFKREPGTILQRDFIRLGQWIIFFAKRMD